MNKSIYNRMKRFHIYIVAILALAGIMTSCSQKETKSLAVPSRSIIVSMPGEEGTTTFESSNITSLTPTSIPEGWTVVNIDMYKATITVKAPESFDNEEVESGTLSLKGYTPTGGTKLVDVYLAIAPKEVDYSANPANCYVACEPKVRYIFNPMIGGNDIQLATAYVKLIWQTEKSLVKYLDMRDGKAVFYLMPEEDEEGNELETVVDGNALIGAYDANDNLIWSWHIWVTNNNPMADTFVVGGTEMMNHNLGADTNNEGSADHDAIGRSYGMYYQWGRKDPLPGPFSWRFEGNQDASLYNDAEKNLYLDYVASSSETGTTEWLRSNPLTIILGNPDNNYDWMYNGMNDTLWDATTKSEEDPCPYGWHVPDGAVYENLTIAAADDNKPWAEAQPLYGWQLEDTTNGNSYFFSAAGRRNYMDGRLDNMNDDMELPVPWSGYYWTASTDGSKANAMYFDLNTQTRIWNGFDSAHAMHRANALPIRCVREK